MGGSLFVSNNPNKGLKYFILALLGLNFSGNPHCHQTIKKASHF